MQLVQNPYPLDVLRTLNLYGGILDNLAASLAAVADVVPSEHMQSLSGALAAICQASGRNKANPTCAAGSCHHTMASQA